MTADADGFLRSRTYGDGASTQALMTPDTRRRLDRVVVSRQSGAHTTLIDHGFAYDGLGNPVRIVDGRLEQQWPAGAKPVSRQMHYDDLSRITRVDYQYAPGGTDIQAPLFVPQDGDALPPLPASHRVGWQTFAFDWLGNIEATDDDAHVFFDRSTGTAKHDGAHRLLHATAPGAGSVSLGYDPAGNMSIVGVARDVCPGTSLCVHRFEYVWDEIGRLARARRYDFAQGTNPLKGSGSPAAELSYAYDAEGQRVLKSAGSASDPRYTLDIFPSLKLEQARWLAPSGAEPARYEHTKDTETVYLASGATPLARVTLSPPTVPGGAQTRVYLMLRDSLGSSSVLIDKQTGELVESITYLPFGSTESDYRPVRWGHERERKRFTGKEDDVEVGLVYFGARYYSPHLGRFISPDPAAIHELKADPNVYAYVSGKVFAAIDPKGLEAIPSAVPGGDPSDPAYWSTLGAYSHLAAPIASVFYGFAAGTVNAPIDLLNNPLGLVVGGVMAFFANTPEEAFLAQQMAEHPDLLPGFLARPDGTNPYESAGYQAGGWFGSVLMLPFAAVSGTESAASIGARSAAGAEMAEAQAARVEAALVSKCFAAGTPLLTCDGGEQPIETIRVGDRVQSRSPQTGAVECREVLRTFERDADDMMAITWSTPDGLERQTVHVTREHPFWIEAKGWVAAGELAIGDRASTASGKPFSVAASHAYSKKTHVFNVEVGANHNYFVGSARLLAHNTCPGDFGGVASDARLYQLYKADLAAQEIAGAPAVGSALKGDVFHRSASFAVADIPLKGHVFTHYNRTGPVNLTQVTGELDGVWGRFEWIVDENGYLTHQTFVRHGTINGVPIVP